MIELTEEQQRILEAEQGQQPRVYNPQTQETFVLVRLDDYERLRSLLDDSIRATAELVDRVMAEDDANDPHLAEYQRLYAKDQP